MKKRLDPQAKAKRQKVIVVAAAGILAVVVGIQAPSLLKRNKQESAAAAPAPAAPAPSGVPTSGDPSGAAGTTAGGALAANTVDGAAKLPADPDPAPVPQRGQLIAFGLFKSKDPFVQQLSARGTGTEETAASASAPAASAPSTAPQSSAPPASAVPQSTPETTPVAPSTTPPATKPVTDPSTTPAPTPATTPTPAPTESSSPPATTPTPAPAPAAASSARISVNGVTETINVGADFPKASPLFRLVAIKDGVAQIGIAGGSLEDGSETVALREGKTLTLMNTADGTRYVLKLIAVS
jgi:hypothetical protein